MSATRIEDVALARLRKAMSALYGERLARVVLFGSRARGDARADSDYDVAVFLRDMPDRYAEMRRLAEVGALILDETGAVVNAMPYCVETYDDPAMPLMNEIRREGVDL